jgi:hypothetical protein
VVILSFGAFSLGYGENSPIWQRGLAILAHGLCLLPLIHGLNALLMLIPPAVFAVNYWLSLKLSWWTHKVVEASAGFSIATTLVLMCLCLWR